MGQKQAEKDDVDGTWAKLTTMGVSHCTLIHNPVSHRLVPVRKAARQLWRWAAPR